MAANLFEKRELEQFQARFVGTGSSDTTGCEWRANVVRDTNSSIVGHPPLLQYYSVGTGQCRERARLALLERMINPTKPLVAPEKKNVEDFEPVPPRQKSVQEIKQEQAKIEEERKQENARRRY